MPLVVRSIVPMSAHYCPTPLACLLVITLSLRLGCRVAGGNRTPRLPQIPA